MVTLVSQSFFFAMAFLPVSWRFVYISKWSKSINLIHSGCSRWINTGRKLVFDNNQVELDLKYYTDFKKIIKLKKLELKDGHTCFRVPCKLCVHNSLGDKWAFVNKTTGNFVCPNCDVKVPLLQAKNSYEREKPFIDCNVAINNLYKTTCNVITQVPTSVCDGLQIKGLKTVDFEILEAGYDPIIQALQFPLKNVSRRVVGEKIFYLENGIEETHQNQNISGILIYEQGSNQRAVVVTNLLDFLVLIAHRIDTRKF